VWEKSKGHAMSHKRYTNATHDEYTGYDVVGLTAKDPAGAFVRFCYRGIGHDLRGVPLLGPPRPSPAPATPGMPGGAGPSLSPEPAACPVP